MNIDAAPVPLNLKARMHQNHHLESTPEQLRKTMYGRGEEFWRITMKPCIAGNDFTASVPKPKDTRESQVTLNAEDSRIWSSFEYTISLIVGNISKRDSQAFCIC
jgi:hypothetical protein